MKRMKQMLVAFMLAVLALSLVPLAAAERGYGMGGNGADNSGIDGRADSVADERVTERSGRRDNSAELREEMRERGMQIKKKLSAQERLEEARRQYQEKKKIHLEGQETLEQRRREAACNADTAECLEKKAKLRFAMQQQLVHTISLISESLSKLQAKVEGSRQLSDAEKQDALQQIAALEERLVQQKAEIAALEDPTAEELREAIRELKHLWQDVRKTQRWIVVQMINRKQDNLVEVYLRMLAKLEALTENLQEQGTETAELEKCLGEFRQDVEDIKVQSGEAGRAWQSAKDSKEKLLAAYEEQREARAAMKQARETLRSCLGEYREARKMANATEGLPAGAPVE